MGNTFGVLGQHTYNRDSHFKDIYKHQSINRNTVKVVTDIEKLSSISLCSVENTETIDKLIERMKSTLGKIPKSGEYGSKTDCKEKRDRWSELEKCIRYIYRNALSENPSVSYNEQIPQDIVTKIQELVDKLWQEDWQQLLIRLEVLVRDFVIEAREHLKELHNVDDLPVRYLKGLLASYGAFCLAADNLAPYVKQLDKLLMKRFSVSFEMLNKYLFQSCLYSNSFIQNNIPLYISQTQYSNQELIHSYLVFDEEMTDIASRWLDVKKLILKFSKKRTLSNKKGVMLLEDWEAYREHRELAANKAWCVRDKTQNNWDSSEFDVQLLSLIDDITSRIPELEVESNNGCKSCKHCNAPIYCTCDDCAIKHILTCGLDTPPASPVSSLDKTSSATHSLSHSQLLRHLIESSKDCNGEGKKGTWVNNSKCKNWANNSLFHIYNGHPSSVFPLIPGYQMNCTNQNQKQKKQSNKGLQLKASAIESISGNEQILKCDTSHTNIEHTTSKVPQGNTMTNISKKKKDKVGKCTKLKANPIETKGSDNLENKSETNRNIKSIINGVINTEEIKNKLDLRENACSNRLCTILNCDHKRQKSLICKKKLSKICCKDDICNCWTNIKVNGERGIKTELTKSEGTETVAATEDNKQKKKGNCGEYCCKKHLRPLSCDRKKSESGEQQTNVTDGIKNHKSMKHCDCSHGDSFEPFNVHINSKFNKLRDRLRHRLNEKRNSQLKKDTILKKEKENVSNVNSNSTPITETVSSKKKPKAKQQPNNPPDKKNSNVDTRDIKDLLEFIEGTDKETKLAEEHKRELKRLKKEKRKEEKRLQAEQELLKKQEEERLLQQIQEAKLKEEARLKKLEQESKKEGKKSKWKKRNEAANNTADTSNTENKTNSGQTKQKSKENGPGNETSKPGPMVTIKRVMENGSKEPTVTITLKGSTPDKDKLLYTLVNGQTDPNGKSDDEKVVKPQNVQLSKKQKKKLKKAQKNETMAVKTPVNEPKKNKKENKAQQQVSTNTTIKPVKEDTSNVHSNNTATTENNVRAGNGLQFQMLRLPPGITITKVEGPTANRKLNINSSSNTAAVSLTVPPKATPTAPSMLPSNETRPGIIVVDTIKLKQQTPTQTAKSTVLPAPVSNEPEKNTSSRSKKNKKKKNKKKENDKEAKSAAQNDVPIEETANGVLTIKNPMFYKVQEAVSEKIDEARLYQTRKVDTNQQASIIKGADGMVTIRSPRLGSVNGTSGRGIPFMSLHSVGAPVLSELKPVVGPNTSTYNPSYKIQENKKPFNAQEILSGLPGIEITKINKSTIKNRSECKKAFQPADVSIIPTNMTNGTNGDVYKLFYDNSDWSLESVFAPKDIKEDEVLDADELELEAFKRFCQQSVPPERKEKVAYLNVKDIILKKKVS